MSILNCSCRGNCTVAAVIVSAILGVLAAFFQITAVITVTPVFLWVAFGIAVVYLGVLAAAAVLARQENTRPCLGAAVDAVLAGILVTVLFAVVLLAVGIVATSVVSAILVGVLVFGFALTLTATACLVRCLLNSES